MSRHAQQLLYRFEAAETSDQEDPGLYRDLGFPDDSVIGIAYAISDWAITWLGPVFWICLVYLLLIAEFRQVASPAGRVVNPVVIACGFA
jgi:hypothetical protein